MLDSKNNISVVIITGNEESQITDCLNSCLQVSQDLVVVDSLSDDGTLLRAEAAGARVFSKKWEGYGKAKNFGAEKAKHDWILSIDADERLDPQMVGSILNQELDKQVLYGFRRLNYIGTTAIKYGEWNPDIKFRFYHRATAKWNHAKVHEQLIGAPCHTKSVLPGYINHYSYRDIQELTLKLDHYARLGAIKMAEGNESPNLFSFLKPSFRFIKSYYLKGGFLDGKLGYQIAKENARASKKKLNYLKESLKND
ncbi:glycosyltransferase family 2 protein [Portibacter lacus]|uniref:Beta 1,4 glucosyltransferase n=1 Tax=Portibacter lacus TaxID=1099794 RepID=A0AA37SQW8_9BACT|nr:glycosyltransferase family 2 protein [Portibacter lacus]GLR19246.1 beta 1,4 glucosyltransferase [Portibacter lacus]